MIVVGIVAILSAIAIPVSASLTHRARTAKAQADTRTIAAAVTMYAAHTGAIPTNAANMSAGLTTTTTVAGLSAGPFLGAVPAEPAGGTPSWLPYVYTVDVAPGGAAVPGAFVVCSSGDATFANSGGVSSCP